jgi:hypothetical protein
MSAAVRLLKEELDGQAYSGQEQADARIETAPFREVVPSIMPPRMIEASTNLGKRELSELCAQLAPACHIDVIALHDRAGERFRRERLINLVRSPFLASTKLLDSDYRFYQRLFEPLMNNISYDIQKTRAGATILLLPRRTIMSLKTRKSSFTSRRF